MSDFTDSAQSKQIDQVEHNNDASSKRVVIRYQDLNDGSWNNWDPSDSTTPISSYGTNDVEEVDTYTYVGKENPAGAWVIMRVVTSSGTTRYAKGASDYTTAWTNKASQSYDTFAATF